MEAANKKIAIIGLGYVGLPLAVEFAKKYPVVGFDINNERVLQLRDNHDRTLEVNSDQLKQVAVHNVDAFLKGNASLWCTNQLKDIESADVFIVTVPTPIDKHNKPVLTPLIKASEIVGLNLKKGNIVIYESTVYPGATEEECVPVLEKFSGLVFNIDFFVGYSPERINPGDKDHTVTKIKKVTSGSTKDAALVVDSLYRSIIEAGTFLASSIKVAEAAKVIENTQRDINIAFVNELAKIFNLLQIDTTEVLEAAATKWNFLRFKPGLVGGHCIGVDPFYLAQKAQEVGYHPEMILAGRRVNDGMGEYVATEVIKLMIKNSVTVLGSKLLLLGITFKENCPDIRNSRAIDIYKALQPFGVTMDICDPWADVEEVEHEFRIALQSFDSINHKQYSAVILAVAHNEFMNIDYTGLFSKETILYDVKGILPKSIIHGRL